MGENKIEHPPQIFRVLSIVTEVKFRFLGAGGRRGATRETARRLYPPRHDQEPRGVGSPVSQDAVRFLGTLGERWRAARTVARPAYQANPGLKGNTLLAL